MNLSSEPKREPALPTTKPATSVWATLDIRRRRAIETVILAAERIGREARNEDKAA